MSRGNGKTEVEPQLDSERELAPADGSEDSSQGAAGVSASGESGELQRLKAERDSLLDRLARMQADFENARKRAARDQQEFREYALTDALKALLPVLDSFDRALDASSGQKSELRNGVELIYKQLHDALGKLGLRTIPAKGQPFDPRWHEAIEMVDTTEAEDHQIIDELQHGYKLKDRLLRPAMVRVARNPKH
ncbi:MAG: nucleotide exchange factor GrpE [Terriglobales bacterium]